MLKPSSAIMGAGLGKDVALITDGRFSGGSHGFLIGRNIPSCVLPFIVQHNVTDENYVKGHIVPEAQDGGPIALVQNGDEIIIDSEKRLLDVSISDTELERRRKEWSMPPFKYQRGTLAKYIK